MNKTKSLFKLNTFLLFSILVGISNLFFSKNYYISLVLVIFEIFILLVLLLKKRYVSYLMFYLAFLTLSFEFGDSIGSSIYYGFKNFRILGVNLGVITLLPYLFLAIVNKRFLQNLRIRYPSHYNVLKVIFVLTVIGIFMGLLNISILNTTNIHFSILLKFFIDRFYELAFLPFLISIAFCYTIIYDESRVYRLSDALFSIMLANSVVLIFSYLFNITGIYGGVSTLAVSSIAIFTPFIILQFFFESKYRNKLFSLLIFVLALLLLVAYNTSGKLLISLIIIPILIISKYLKAKSFIKALVILSAVTLLILVFLTFGDFDLSGNIVLSSKINQVLKLVNVFSGNWLSELPYSPRIRVLEFLNIVSDFLKSPWNIILGEGFGASIYDYHIFPYEVNTFSDFEWMSRTFFYMHMSFNTIFLTFGLLGVYILIVVLIRLGKYLIDSTWIIIGLYWISFIYGYSLVLSSFGLISLLMGIYVVKINHRNRGVTKWK